MLPQPPLVALSRVDQAASMISNTICKLRYTMEALPAGCTVCTPMSSPYFT